MEVNLVFISSAIFFVGARSCESSCDFFIPMF
jgi:hypothetical protein